VPQRRRTSNAREARAPSQALPGRGQLGCSISASLTYIPNPFLEPYLGTRPRDLATRLLFTAPHYLSAKDPTVRTTSHFERSYLLTLPAFAFTSRPWFLVRTTRSAWFALSIESLLSIDVLTFRLCASGEHSRTRHGHFWNCPYPCISLSTPELPLE